MTSGKYLKLLRVEHDYTLSRLSAATSIDMSFLSKLERMKAVLTSSHIELISNEIGVSDEQRTQLYDLAAAEQCKYPDDCVTLLEGNESIPVLLRTIAKASLTDIEIYKLITEINNKFDLAS